MDNSKIFYNVDITASLKLTTPMLVGDGDDGLDNRLAACRTNNGNAYIPGSSIKGSMLALVSKVSAVKDFEWAFGAAVTTIEGDQQAKKQGLGGKVRFLDSLTTSQAIKPFINTRNSIERTTGTAKDSHLFELDMLPVGTEFQLKLQIDKATEQKLSELKGLIEAWGVDANSLGRGANQSYGEFSVADISIKAVPEKTQQTWLLDLISSTDKTAESNVSKPSEGPQSVEIAITATSLKSLNDNRAFKIDISLTPLGPIFVGNAKPEKAIGDENTVIKPRRNQQGMVILPSTSFRGAIRSQAEKIISTLLDLDASEEPPVQELFGSTDQKSRLKITDFTAEKNQNPKVQTMLAIDRFTGAVKSGATYNIERVDIGNLNGSIILDSSLFDVERQAELALLFMLLRDLFDAEICFGAYKAKGFGKVTAQVKFNGSDDSLSSWSEFYRAWEELVEAKEQQQQLPTMDELNMAFKEKFTGAKEKADV